MNQKYSETNLPNNLKSIDEKHIEHCWQEIVNYCNLHETCEGCIFYWQITMGDNITANCRLQCSPEEFRRYEDG